MASTAGGQEGAEEGWAIPLYLEAATRGRSRHGERRSRGLEVEVGSSEVQPSTALVWGWGLGVRFSQTGAFPGGQEALSTGESVGTFLSSQCALIQPHL